VKEESAPRCFIRPNYRLAEKARPIAQTIVIQQKKNNQGHPPNVMILCVSQREDHGGWGDTLHLGSSVNELRITPGLLLLDLWIANFKRIPPYVVPFRQPNI
jgi:hypothetical protein